MYLLLLHHRRGPLAAVAGCSAAADFVLRKSREEAELRNRDFVTVGVGSGVGGAAGRAMGSSLTVKC